jgi:hypothetical protein
MLKTSLFLIALIVVGCNEERASQQSQALSKSVINRTMIQGIWWSSEMPQSAAFAVNDSTFYYPEHFVERKYEVKDDSLFVFFDDGYVGSSAIVKLTADTLILSTNGTVRLYTRTEPKE